MATGDNKYNKFLGFLNKFLSKYNKFLNSLLCNQLQYEIWRQSERWFRNYMGQALSELASWSSTNLPKMIDRENPYPRGYRFPNFSFFSREDGQSTLEHVVRFTMQCGELANYENIYYFKLILFPNSLT